MSSQHPKTTYGVTPSATKGYGIFSVHMGYATVFQAAWPWQALHDMGMHIVNIARQNGAKPVTEAPAQTFRMDIVDGKIVKGERIHDPKD